MEITKISKKQLTEMVSIIENRKDYRTIHFREVKDLPKDSIRIGYEQASYGDYCYFITPDGEYVCTYYSIGDWLCF